MNETIARKTVKSNYRSKLDIERKNYDRIIASILSIISDYIRDKMHNGETYVSFDYKKYIKRFGGKCDSKIVEELMDMYKEDGYEVKIEKFLGYFRPRMIISWKHIVDDNNICL